MQALDEEHVTYLYREDLQTTTHIKSFQHNFDAHQHAQMRG